MHLILYDPVNNRDFFVSLRRTFISNHVLLLYTNYSFLFYSLISKEKEKQILSIFNQVPNIARERENNRKKINQYSWSNMYTSDLLIVMYDLHAFHCFFFFSSSSSPVLIKIMIAREISINSIIFLCVFHQPEARQLSFDRLMLAYMYVINVVDTSFIRRLSLVYLVAFCYMNKSYYQITSNHLTNNSWRRFSFKRMHVFFLT